jgi:N-acetyl sugar amidotransferase
MIKVCKRCVMDETAKNIQFDEKGFCNFCTDFEERYLTSHILKSGNNLESFVNFLKNKYINKKYDCVIGLSGGVDSAWVLLQAKNMGLRPIAVHMDNGWNSELAQNNIANLVKRLNVDLYTHVIDWEEYREFMNAFFDADVVDIELLYDNAMLAVNYKIAAKYGIKHILAGTNMATEGMRTPLGWNWFKYDKKNIVNIGETNRDIKVKTLPVIGTFLYIWYRFVLQIKWVPFLNYFNYNKSEALGILERDYAFKPYPFKHYESIFTRFYQGYILPNKFNIDKRKLHFSTLIVSGQMTRDQALKGLAGIAYTSESDLEKDKEYFIKKMNWSEKQLNDYLIRPEKPHTNYKSEKNMWNMFFKIYQKNKKNEFNK